MLALGFGSAVVRVMQSEPCSQKILNRHDGFVFAFLRNASRIAGGVLTRRLRSTAHFPNGFVFAKSLR